jgi:hypothetical protein
MSTATSPPPVGEGGPAPWNAMTAGPPGPAVPRDGCPLCGSPLDPQQEWCLRCGAAARTRLAAAPNWKGPIAALLVVSALALGALTAALIKLAADSGPAPPPRTVVVTGPAAALTPSTPASTLPTSTTPTTTTPGGATTPRKSGSAVTPGSSTTAGGGTAAPGANVAPTTTGYAPLNPTLQKSLEHLHFKTGSKHSTPR